MAFTLPLVGKSPASSEDPNRAKRSDSAPITTSSESSNKALSIGSQAAALFAQVSATGGSVLPAGSQLKRLAVAEPTRCNAGPLMPSMGDAAQQGGAMAGVASGSALLVDEVSQKIFMSTEEQLQLCLNEALLKLAATKEILKQMVAHSRPWEPRQFHSNEELQEAAVEVSDPYMKIVCRFDQALAGLKALFNGQLERLDPGLRRSTETAIQQAFEPFEKKHRSDLIEIFIDDVVRQREAMLYFGNNRDLARGAGANNTYYVEADEAGVLRTLTNGGTVLDALKDSLAIVINRIAGPGKFDGIGAMGGLIETTRRHFPEFDPEKFNRNDSSFKAYLQKQLEERKTNLANGKVPPHLIVSTQYVVDTATLLLQLMDNKADTTVRPRLMSHLDDIYFHENGDLGINTDPLLAARRAAAREAQEEGAEVSGLGCLLNRLAVTTIEGERAQLLMGANNTLVDDNYFLRVRGITSLARAPAQAVSPVMLGTKCHPKAFGEFAAGLQAVGNSKFVSPMTHGEISGCEVLSLNDLRRRAGLTADGKLTLAEAVGVRNAEYGKYAYRYVHEAAGTALKLSVMQLAKALKYDPKQIAEKLCSMAREDQQAIFEIDHRDHRINYLSQAKVMFKKDLKIAKQNDPHVSDAVLDKVAYLLLAQELKVDGVTDEVIQRMDEAVSIEHARLASVAK